ncbi:MAG: histidine kinase [Pyrinomonadaceae bacterium]|jgi:sensor histidine kinase YesM|nr:histidine kinase [Pyrinomonadaceae bacterium]
MQKPKNNQTWLDIIRSTQTLKHLAFFGLGCLSWLGFSYLYSFTLKIIESGSIYEYVWTSDTPKWFFLFCIIGAFVIILTKWILGLLTENSKSLFRDFLILILLIPFNSIFIIGFLTFVLKGSASGGNKPVEYDLVAGFLIGFIIQTFVAMTCIGYFYLNLVNQTKERLFQAQQAKTAMELKTLQQNIEPHFLFNNLNVLSSLIESNPQRANEFLEKLSELYRYILQTQNDEIVPIQEEIEFAKKYVYLLQERFGVAYNFVWELPESKLKSQMIIPVALQTLIENAVKHNAGSHENPLPISIKLVDDYLLVENEIRAKQLTFQTNKSGLQNLKTRYVFLTDKPIEITKNNQVFKIKLPLLEAK